jgi:folate-binding protein YgfZ
MRGKDSRDFLHRLSTNDILPLAPGLGCPTAVLSTRGRILDLLLALCDDEGLFLLGSEGSGLQIAAHLDQYLFREEVTLEEVHSTVCVGLYGPSSPMLLAKLSQGDWQTLELGHHRPATIAGIGLTVAGGWPLEGAGFLFLCPAGAAGSLEACLAEQGATAASPGQIESWRIKAMVPAAGKELTEEFNPWEISLDKAISLVKGCYLGQEIVARLHTYRKVQRRLVGIEVDAGEGLAKGSPLFSAAETVGEITSSALDAGRVVALGVLKTSHCRSGEELEVTVAGKRERCRVRASAPPLAAALAAPY